MSWKFAAGLPAVATLSEFLVHRYTEYYTMFSAGPIINVIPAQVIESLPVVPRLIALSFLAVLVSYSLGHREGGFFTGLIYGLVGAAGFAAAYAIGMMFILG